MTPTELKSVLDKFRQAESAYASQRKRESDDLKCQTPDGLWDATAANGRKEQTINGMKIPARPMLGIDTLSEPVFLVLNQERAAQLTPHVHAASEEANDDTAKIIEDLYRQAAVSSRANVARSWAYDRSTKAGLGGYRIDKVYDSEGGHPFDQKLVWKRILDQSRIYPDPFAQEPDWSDGECLFIGTDYRESTFKRKYKKSKLAKYTSEGFNELAADEDYKGWITGDTPETRRIRVCEYWRVEITTQTWVLLDDGSSVSLRSEIPDGRTELMGDGARSRDEEVRRVYWSLISCMDELTVPQEWDGQYIPIIPTIGRELQPHDGERMWIGMYHNAKDGARLTNVAASNAVEMAAHEPKAPWQGEEGVFEGHEKEYQESAYRTLPYLQYKPTNSAGERSTAPQRVQVSVAAMSPSLELLTMGQQFVRQATFAFGPALGEQTPAHRSGKAITALQDQTTFGTSHYLDNLATITLPYEALVVLDLIPHVYDRPGRIARILDDKNVQSAVMLNQPFVYDANTNRPTSVQTPGDPQMAADDRTNPIKLYDLKKGRYAVTVTIGKTNPSRLQEGNEQIGAFLEAAPEMLIPLGPEFMKFQDYPGASAIADTLKKMRDHDLPWLSEDPSKNPAAELARLQAENQQLKQVATEMQKQIETDAIKAQTQAQIASGKDAVQAQIAAGKDAAMLEKARMDNATKMLIADMDDKIARLELAMEELRQGGVQAHESDEAERDRAHEAGTQAMGHAQTLDQQQQAADLAPKPKPNGSGA